ncbi:MAG: hypothetical protein R3B93_16120 [Bacteroidia bacterium]
MDICYRQYFNARIFYVLNDTTTYLTERWLKRIPKEGIHEWLGPTVLIINTQDCSIKLEDSNLSSLYQEMVRNTTGKITPKYKYFVKEEGFLHDSVLLKIDDSSNISNCINSFK